ncbi:MBL fold metallo-hydrolase [Natronomonas sp. EA1]|uniref:MBL fold metallo-hydrolase n=1 Tax=Natronomonas sp. EA1 TaxID=3421655 RepID=UPI003EC103A0
MIASDWGDWLPREVETADPDGLDIWYLGCNGFVLKADDGTTVYIDPYLGTGDPPRTVRMIPVPFDPDAPDECDAVLATHEHTDHVHGPSQGALMRETGAAFYGPSASIAVTQEEGWVEEYDLRAEQFHDVAEGQTVELGSLTIHVEPAHDPDAEHPVSYVIEHDAGTFFHGGDARPSEHFADIGERYDIDLGVLAFGSTGMIPDKETGEPTLTTWYSDENMIAEAARQLELDRLLPSHWDMWRGMTADPTALRHHIRSFDAPRTLELVEIGDRVSL